MPEIISSAVALSSFNLFPSAPATGAAFDPSLKPKSWAAPVGFDFAGHVVQDFGDFLMFPLAYDPSKVALVRIIVPREEVFTVNIPPSQYDPNQLHVLPGYLVPIDSTRWDEANYYISIPTPFHISNPQVRDHRADGALAATYTQGDQARLVRIEDLLKELMGK